MRFNFLGIIVAGAALAFSGVAVTAHATQQTGSGSGQGSGQGQRMRGMGGFPGGGRGVLGTVAEVAPDHYTIKTDAGETYTVHFSANTRILKQGPRQGGGRRQARPGQAGSSQSGAAEGGEESQGGGERATPQSLKSTDIKVGDIITAGGEVDAAAKSIGAVVILQVDPERAKQMREMQANYGKTWLAGRITGIEGTTITIEGMIDHAPHTIAIDENTSLRQRRDSITLADIKPGQQLRAEGSVKNGAFLATQVTAMEPQNRDPNREQNRDQPPGAASSQPKPQ
jgi:preprotein translocase subunit YajC